MAKYRMVVAHWALVEASMSEHYGLDLHGILTMSWRRFRVLYNHLFVAGHLTQSTPSDSAVMPQSAGGKTPKFDPIDDWNRLAGVPAADKKVRMSFNEFSNNFGLKKKTV